MQTISTRNEKVGESNELFSSRKAAIFPCNVETVAAIFLIASRSRASVTLGGGPVVEGGTSVVDSSAKIRCRRSRLT